MVAAAGSEGSPLPLHPFFRRQQLSHKSLQQFSHRGSRVCDSTQHKHHNHHVDDGNNDGHYVDEGINGQLHGSGLNGHEHSSLSNLKLCHDEEEGIASAANEPPPVQCNDNARHRTSAVVLRDAGEVLSDAGEVLPDAVATVVKERARVVEVSKAMAVGSGDDQEGKPTILWHVTVGAIADVACRIENNC